MNQYTKMIRSLKTPVVMEQLAHLYGSREGMLVEQITRYTKLLKRHEDAFHAEGEVRLISASGRTEIGGNHTDHNRGKVLAAAVNLDTVAAVSARDDMLVRFRSEGYRPITVDLGVLDVQPQDNGTTVGIIRGTAARMAEMGYKVGGFDAVVTSSVMSGSGLSSSAAVEVLICAILDKLYNGSIIPADVRAQIGQYAENKYFGKPSGLLDQMTSSVGGLVTVDFKHDTPSVRPLQYDFARKGYDLIVVATGGSHADLTDCYAAIPAEMKEVAAQFGAACLRGVRPEEFYHNLSALRGKVSDRAILRAMHFYEENARVVRQVAALENDDLPAFLKEIKASGRSSFMYLQNIYASEKEQGLSLALALAEKLLGDKGAWRVHGGGFAGTTLNFVPQDMQAVFVSVMEGVFGPHCCHVLSIRPEGAAEILCPQA